MTLKSLQLKGLNELFVQHSSLQKRIIKKRVTCVTKANVIKTTDGKFLDVFNEVAKEYPGIEADDWYIDIMTAKLVDEKRRKDFQVMVLPIFMGTY